MSKYLSINTKDYDWIYEEDRLVHRILARAGIKSINDLSEYTKKDIFKFHHFGQVRYEKLLKFMIEHNLDNIFTDKEIISDIQALKNEEIISDIQTLKNKEDNEMASRINPFIEARYKLGYHNCDEFEHEIGLGAGTYKRWECGMSEFTNSRVAVGAANFCRMTGWTMNDLNNILAMVCQWKKLGIKLVAPKWEPTDKVRLADCIKTEEPKPDTFEEFTKNALADAMREEAKSVEEEPSTETSQAVESEFNRYLSLKTWRIHNRHSMREMAQMAGIDHFHYCQIEDGEVRATQEEAEVISRITNIPVETILGICKKESPIERINNSLRNKTDELLEKQTVEYGGEVYPEPVVTEAPDPEPRKPEIDRAREILNIVYNKVTLEEYLKIIDLLKYKEV